MMITPYEIQFVLKPKPNAPVALGILMAMQKVIQDASTDHATVIGYGKTDMDAYNLFWAIARLRVTFLKPLKADETYAIKTWPNPSDAVGIDRNYLVFDSFGELVVKGMGKWVIVDKTSFKLVKPKNCPLTNNQTNLLIEKVYPDGYRRYPIDDSKPTFSLERTVQDYEIDHNGHVNNVVYLDYLFSTVNEWNGSPLEVSEYQLNYSDSLFKDDQFIIHLVNHKDDLSLSAYRIKADGNSLAFQAQIQKK